MKNRSTKVQLLCISVVFSVVQCHLLYIIAINRSFMHLGVHLFEVNFEQRILASIVKYQILKFVNTVTYIGNLTIMQ